MQDPFGDLVDCGSVLDLLRDLADKGQLTVCQAGLIRILKYRGNWRLREEVLRQVSQMENPTVELIHQVLAVLADDNIYYDARILASSALIALLEKTQDGFHSEVNKAVQKVTDRLMATPQPPFFDEALKELYQKIELQTALHDGMNAETAILNKGAK